MHQRVCHVSRILELLGNAESIAQTMDHYREAYQKFMDWFAERPVELFKIAQQKSSDVIEQSLMVRYWMF